MPEQHLMLDISSVDLFMLGWFIRIQHLMHPSDRFSITTQPVMLSSSGVSTQLLPVVTTSQSLFCDCCPCASRGSKCYYVFGLYLLAYILCMACIIFVFV